MRQVELEQEMAPGGGVGVVIEVAAGAATVTPVPETIQAEHTTISQPELTNGANRHAVSANTDDNVAIYLADIGRESRVTKEEERELGHTIQAGIAAAEELAEHADGLTRHQRRRLEQDIQRGSVAEERLVLANLRLVVWIAKRYRSAGAPMSDIIQEGNIGLIRAAQKFDPNKGFAFSTYAPWWIRQAITRNMSGNADSMRLPGYARGILETLSKYEAPRPDGTRMSDEEICELMGIDEEKLTEYRSWVYRGNVLHLDEVDEDTGTALYEIVNDPLAETVEDVAESNADAELIRRLTGDLLETLLTPGERAAFLSRLEGDKRRGPRNAKHQVPHKKPQRRTDTSRSYRKAVNKLRHPSQAFNVDTYGMLPEDDEWKLRAQCLGAAITDIFPSETRGNSVHSRGPQQKIIEMCCAICPIQEECAAIVETQVTVHGIWGGEIYSSKGRPIRATGRKPKSRG